MIKIAICDDEIIHRERALHLINEYAQGKSDTSIVASAFFSPNQLLNAINEYGGYDVYILDVVMPEMSGIDLGLEIRKSDTDGKIIFLTSSSEFGVESYSTGAFFYMLKPFDNDKMFSVLDSAISQVRNRRDKEIIVKTKEDSCKISFDDILSVELVHRQLVFTLTCGDTVRSVTVRTPFIEAVAQLVADERFFLCGASMVINLYHVTSVERDSVVFKKNKKMYMPKSYCPSIRSAWMDFWMKNGGNK